MTNASRVVVVGALVAFGAFALAAVLFLQSTSDASERLGLLFAMFGTIVAALIGALRSDQAAATTIAASTLATTLNGNLDTRVRNAVRQVQAEPAGAPHEPLPSPTSDQPPA